MFCLLVFSGDYLSYIGTKGDEIQPGFGLLITMVLTAIPPRWSRVISHLLSKNVLSQIFTKNEYADVNEQLEQMKDESSVKYSNNPSQSPRE